MKKYRSEEEYREEELRKMKHRIPQFEILGLYDQELPYEAIEFLPQGAEFRDEVWGDLLIHPETGLPMFVDAGNPEQVEYFKKSLDLELSLEEAEELKHMSPEERLEIITLTLWTIREEILFPPEHHTPL